MMSESVVELGFYELTFDHKNVKKKRWSIDDRLLYNLTEW